MKLLAIVVLRLTHSSLAIRMPYSIMELPKWFWKYTVVLVSQSLLGSSQLESVDNHIKQGDDVVDHD